MTIVSSDEKRLKQVLKYSLMSNGIMSAANDLKRTAEAVKEAAVVKIVFGGGRFSYENMAGGWLIDL
ncbi:hypothetical protein Tco_1125891, partial [Tanacetum coccineum]